MHDGCLRLYFIKTTSSTYIVRGGDGKGRRKMEEGRGERGGEKGGGRKRGEKGEVRREGRQKKGEGRSDYSVEVVSCES